MFKQKNVLISLAVAALLTACGGGGGSDSTDTTTPPATTPPATTPPATTPPATTPPATTPPDTATPVDQTTMKGFLQLVGDELVFSTTTITVAQLQNEGNGFPQGVGPFARGTNAPLQSFGIRVMPEEMSSPDVVEAKRVRMAFDLTEEANSAGVGETAESLQLMIDQVDISVSASNAATEPNKLSVTVPSTAKLYVYIKGATAAPVNLTVSGLPANVIKLNNIAGDPFSKAFTLDLEALMTHILATAQGTDLAAAQSVAAFVGTFSMKTTVSNVSMKRANAAALTGPSITVTGSNQPAVTGAGVAGRVIVQ